MVQTQPEASAVMQNRLSRGQRDDVAKQAKSSGARSASSIDPTSEVRVPPGRAPSPPCSEHADVGAVEDPVPGRCPIVHPRWGRCTITADQDQHYEALGIVGHPTHSGEPDAEGIAFGWENIETFWSRAEGRLTDRRRIKRVREYKRAVAAAEKAAERERRRNDCDQREAERERIRAARASGRPLDRGGDDLPTLSLSDLREGTIETAVLDALCLFAERQVWVTVTELAAGARNISGLTMTEATVGKRVRSLRAYGFRIGRRNRSGAGATQEYLLLNTDLRTGTSVQG